MSKMWTNSCVAPVAETADRRPPLLTGARGDDWELTQTVVHAFIRTVPGKSAGYLTVNDVLVQNCSHWAEIHASIFLLSFFFPCGH